MKHPRFTTTPHLPRALTAIAAGACIAATASLAFAQGSLTPPGAPAPTMKTLDQLDAKLDTATTKIDAVDAKAEKRTPISALPFTISAPGSYYLTGNLNVPAGQDGINITTNDVALDLNGFALNGAGAVAGAHGIVIGAGLKNTHILRGAIVGWPGKGISSGANTSQTVCEDLRVRNCVAGGIAIGDSSAVRHCHVNNCTAGPGVSVGFTAIVEQTLCDHCSKGIVATQSVIVRNCSVTFCSGNGIETGPRALITDCVGTGNVTNGIVTGGDAVITRCAIDQTGGVAINAGNASSVQDCTIGTQGTDALLLGGACFAQRNMCSGFGGGSGAIGIRATGGGNRIEDNHIFSVGKGIVLVGGGTITIRNTIESSTTPLTIPAGNITGTAVATEAAMNSAANSNVNIVLP